jgi:hypothetical protein
MLNVSVDQLLELRVPDGSISAASTPFMGSPVPSSTGVAASPQPWIPAPHNAEHGHSHHDSESSSAGFTGQDSPFDLINQFGTQSEMTNWLPSFEPDTTSMPNTPYASSMTVGGSRMLEVQHMHQLPGSILNGQLESPGAEDFAATPYDQSSDIASNYDSPQWEDMQVASIAANRPYNDNREAWLNDAQVQIHLNTSSRPGSGIDSPNTSNQMVPSSLTTGDWEVVKHQSRSPFADKILRDETSTTRKLKACVRCRMQKIRVRDTAPNSDLKRLTTNSA